MKKHLIALISLFALLTLVLTGCSQNTVTSPYKKDTEAFGDIISSLEEGYFYAFADMDEENDVLLVTDTTYEDPDTGDLMSTKATVYGFDDQGNVKKYGTIEAGSTADPLAAKDHYVYYGSHHTMSKATIDESASKMVVKTGKDDMADGTEEEQEAFDQYYDEYFDATVITFTAVEK